MSKIREFVESLDVHNGDRWRGDCPVCHGKNTFTVTNEMGSLLYHCYKASCGIGGGYDVHMSASDIRKVLRGQVDDVPTSINFDLPPSLVPMRNEFREGVSFCEHWKLSETDCMYDIKEDRVVLPVYHNGMVVDAVGRAVKHSKFKWKRYGNAHIPYIKRSVVGDNSKCVLVEDAISAYTVARLLPAAGLAIMGTSLTAQQKQFIGDNFVHVVVALDRDALDKQLEIARDLSSCVPSVKVARLSDDFKYAHEDDIQKLSDMITMEV